MAANWKASKAISDRFNPEIREGLAHVFGAELEDVTEAPRIQDQKENTDMLVQVDHDVTLCVSCRVRSHATWLKYPDDFTMRYRQPADAKTEVAKVMEGWGDYMFFGHAGPKHKRLHAWRVYDLSVFRATIREHQRGNLITWPAGHCVNPDGTEFLVFSRHTFPDNFTVATHGCD